ncbi:MAG: (deoxy)nucleoside triphosphate pyrophosphohydrolase [Acidobacteriaceae bacterium]
MTDPDKDPDKTVAATPANDDKPGEPHNGTRSDIRTVRPVAAALILRGDEVLICQRRPDQPLGSKWEFPGGKMEAGETAEEALRRELQEELGIDATISTLVAHVRHNYRNGSAVDLQFFLVREYTGEVKNLIFQDVRWCPLRNLPEYDFVTADRNLVRDLAAGKLL